jgi:hypothetical protein
MDAMLSFTIKDIERRMYPEIAFSQVENAISDDGFRRLA